jgi:hypothetical protein
MAGFRPDSFESNHIRPDSGHFGQIGLSVDDGQNPATVTEFRRRLDFDDRQLLNFSNQISNVRARTKSLISENDLRF